MRAPRLLVAFAALAASHGATLADAGRRFHRVGGFCREGVMQDGREVDVPACEQSCWAQEHPGAALDLTCSMIGGTPHRALRER
jgi:hypothetical protein